MLFEFSKFLWILILNIENLYLTLDILQSWNIFDSKEFDFYESFKKF